MRPALIIGYLIFVTRLCLDDTLHRADTGTLAAKHALAGVEHRGLGDGVGKGNGDGLGGGKPALLLVNKVESPTRELEATDFYSLAMGEPLCISAMHGLEIGELLEALLPYLPESEMFIQSPGGLHLLLELLHRQRGRLQLELLAGRPERGGRGHILELGVRGPQCDLRVRADVVDRESLRAMKQAGLRVVHLGIESASHPDYLGLIDKKMLEETDSFIRAGIARTDILSMSARLNEKLGVNLWQDMPRLEREIMEMESPAVMKKRLEKAYGRFGERLRSTGPDCGLGSWPSQNLAARLLENCASAVRDFRSEKGLD